MKSLLAVTAALCLPFATSSIAQTASSLNAPPPAPAAASSAKPAPAAADMQVVLDALAGLQPKPIETLTPVQARLQPGAADAALAVLRAKNMSTAPDPDIVTKDLPYGADPMQFARIYRPAAAAAGTVLPIIVYYHGGGWVIADVNTYDATPRFLSKQLNAIVISVEYRHAPEAKFPAQHDDAISAYAWAAKSAQAWGGDPARIALAGESAGGNLAVATAIKARDMGLRPPVHILSVYPIANNATTLPSRQDSANAKPLNSAMLTWFGHYYSRAAADQQDPRINLVKANLKGLPPVTIINAQIDPLRSDGETLADALRSAGVKTEQKTFEGVTHEFFGMGKIVRGAYDAEMWAVTRLKPALAK